MRSVHLVGSSCRFISLPAIPPSIPPRNWLSTLDGSSWCWCWRVVQPTPGENGWHVCPGLPGSQNGRRRVWHVVLVGRGDQSAASLDGRATGLTNSKQHLLLVGSHRSATPGGSWSMAAALPAPSCQQRYRSHGTAFACPSKKVKFCVSRLHYGYIVRRPWSSCGVASPGSNKVGKGTSRDCRK